MDNSFEDYNTKLDNIIKNIKINNKRLNTTNNLKIKKTPTDKDFYCKQLDSLNYCLEMHKVRQNKKADFDIYSTQKYNIEDENIGKLIKYVNWKDLDSKIQDNLIEDFVIETSRNYNLDINYTREFVNSNINKIKYNKYEKKIENLSGMIHCIHNNKNILKIKMKEKTINNNLNKLKKSLHNSKKK